MRGYYESRARLFRVLGHPGRLRILEMLAAKPCCVCDLMQQLNYRQPYVSQQLAILREAGLVVGEREGVNIRYRLASPEVLRLVQSERDLPVDDSPSGRRKRG